MGRSQRQWFIVSSAVRAVAAAQLTALGVTKEMRRISTSIDVGAPASRVWAILMDFPAYADWNPFVRHIVGTGTVGSKLQVTLQPVGGRAMFFAPEVLACDPKRQFRWRGKLFVAGVFDGEHAFEITNSVPTSCRFVHTESFSGVLVPLLMRGTMRAGTEAGFEAMNRALKARAERSDT
jgi:hypothetical protein